MKNSSLALGKDSPWAGLEGAHCHHDPEVTFLLEVSGLCLQGSGAGGSPWGVSADRGQIWVAVPGRCSSDTGPAKMGRSGCCGRLCLCRCSLPERCGVSARRGWGAVTRLWPGRRSQAYLGSKGQAKCLPGQLPQGLGKGQNTCLDWRLIFCEGFTRGVRVSSLQGCLLPRSPPSGLSVSSSTPHQVGSGQRD